MFWKRVIEHIIMIIFKLYLGFPKADIHLLIMLYFRIIVLKYHCF